MSMRSRKDNGDPHLDLGADERVRDRIQKVMDLDVVVEIDPRAPPFCELPIVGGQGDEGVALDKSGRSRGTSEALGRIVRWPTTNNSRPPSTRDRCFAFLQSEFEENGAAHLRDALKARNFVGEIGGPFSTQSPCERTAATSDRVLQRRRFSLVVGLQSRGVKVDHIRIAQLPAEFDQFAPSEPVVVAQGYRR